MPYKSLMGDYYFHHLNYYEVNDDNEEALAKRNVLLRKSHEIQSNIDTIIKHNVFLKSNFCSLIINYGSYNTYSRYDNFMHDLDFIETILNNLNQSLGLNDDYSDENIKANKADASKLKTSQKNRYSQLILSGVNKKNARTIVGGDTYEDWIQEYTSNAILREIKEYVHNNGVSLLPSLIVAPANNMSKITFDIVDDFMKNNDDKSLHNYAEFIVLLPCGYGKTLLSALSSEQYGIALSALCCIRANNYVNSNRQSYFYTPNDSNKNPDVTINDVVCMMQSMQYSEEYLQQNIEFIMSDKN